MLKDKARKQGELLIYVSPGDLNQGKSTSKQWELDTQVRKTLRPLLGTIGNHETYLSLDVFINTLVKLNSKDNPVPSYIVSNLTIDAKELYRTLIEKGLLITEPFIYEDQGIKVGFIGVGPELSNPLLQHHGFTLDDKKTYKIVEEQAQELKSKGVDIVVVISHRGGDWDRKLACQDFSRHIDLILGGHDHISCSDLIEGQTLFTHEDRSQTIVANAGAFGMYLSEIGFSRNENGRFKVLDHKLLSTSDYHEDQNFLDIVKKGKGKFYFTPFSSLSRFSSKADLESILQAVATTVKLERCVQVGIVRKKAIRFDDENPLNEVSEYELETLLPYDDEIVICNFKGDKLISAFEESKKFANKYPTLGHGLVFAGLREGPRGLEVEVEPNCWQNIKSEKKYTIAMSKYKCKDFPSLDVYENLVETGKVLRYFVNASLLS